MSTNTRVLLGAFSICACLLATGCGPGGPTVVPVSGTATLDGQPLEGFLVQYIPDNDKGNKLEVDCSGRLGGGGKYKLTTDDRYNVYEGAPPGWYKVIISSPDDKPIPVNKKYHQPLKSDMSVEVVADAPAGAYDLKFTK